MVDRFACAMSGNVVGVVGGSGGVGASTLAACFAAAAPPSVLVDLDVNAGGIDVALGLEGNPGARWSGLRVAGGRLDPDELAAGLLRWGPGAVLAADVPSIEPDAAVQVVQTAKQCGSVVIDLARAPSPARASVLPLCDLVVVLARADVVGLVAAHTVVGALDAARTGLIVRRGEVPGPDAAHHVGCALLGELPSLCSGRMGYPSRAMVRVAHGVLRGIRPPPDDDHPSNAGALP